MNAHRRFIGMALGLVIATAPAAASAQGVRTGRITGTIADNTGAVLPGVTVTVTSPALQVPQLVDISDERGEYQILELPPGTYRVVYELSGFSRLVREDIRLTTGFAARVDVALLVASLAETVIVSGQSPLVDLSNTRGGTTVGKDLIESTPNNQDYQSLFLLVGGVQILGPPIAGEAGLRPLAAQVAPKTYGQQNRTTDMLEGIVVLPNESPDFTSVEEVDIKTYGNTAEHDNPGAAVQLVVKSGGNQFHGRYVEKAQHSRFQSQNVDDELRAQGISAGDGIKFYQDFSADLGGRIIRDRLWFYGAFHDLSNERTAPGYSRSPGADGVYGNLDDEVGALPAISRNGTLKLSYQATQRHKFVGFWSRNTVVDEESEGARFTPYESTVELSQPTFQTKGEWQMATSRLLANTMYADSNFVATRKIQPEFLDVPNRFDRETGFQTGASFNSLVGWRKPWRRQLAGRMDYFPAGTFLGSHELQVGYRFLWGGFETSFPSQQRGYRLLYDRVGGVAGQPAELHVRNQPLHGESRQNRYAMFVSDSWKPTRRLSVNLGLRWERSNNFVAPQVKEQGRFGGAGSFPRVDAGQWIGAAPRLGMAFDLTGDGKTVVKGTYGLYNHDMPNDYGVGFAHQYNQNNITTTVYRWRDLDRNNDYTPGEVNLDPNGPDFLSVAGATNNIVNPDLKLIHTHEITGSVERELGGGVSIRGLYVYKIAMNNIGTTNILRPYDVFNRAFTRRDAGPDGILNNADDAGSFTIYDYDPAYRGTNFVANMLVNTPDRNDSFGNYEFTLSKRPSGKWFAYTSFLMTKYHRWLEVIPQSPNDELFPLDETWEVAFRLAGGYSLPYGINLSTLYQAYNGIPGQRTVIFRAADPDGGPAFPSSPTITLRVEPFGSQRGESRHVANFRVSKSFRLGGSRQLSLDLDANNAFNSNVAWGSATAGAGSGINFQSGPTFGYVTRIVGPRALRFGVAYEF